MLSWYVRPSSFSSAWHQVQTSRLSSTSAGNTSAPRMYARDRAAFAGAEVTAMSIAALRATTEETRDHGGQSLNMVRGTLSDGRQAALWPGTLPEDPARLLHAARGGAERWLDGDFGLMTFAPPRLTLRPGEGPPHIRMDRAAEFLLGDRLD